MQVSHATQAGLDEYVHTPDRYCPLRQLAAVVQLLQTGDVVEEHAPLAVWPAGQVVTHGRHAPDPLTDLKVPAVQAVQLLFVTPPQVFDS